MRPGKADSQLSIGLEKNLMRRTLCHHTLALILPLLLLLAACGSHAPPSPVLAAPQGRAHGVSLRQAIVRTAASLQGTPYRYGGCDPQDGFDCSGYVNWVYARHDIRLPRTTRDQIRAGQAVNWRGLGLADLVFFDIGRGNLHVGIYAGDGMFLHSPKTGGVVRVESLNKRYWTQRFAVGRRVVE